MSNYGLSSDSISRLNSCHTLSTIPCWQKSALNYCWSVLQFNAFYSYSCPDSEDLFGVPIEQQSDIKIQYAYVFSNNQKISPVLQVPSGVFRLSPSLTRHTFPPHFNSLWSINPISGIQQSDLHNEARPIDITGFKHIAGTPIGLFHNWLLT